MPIANLHDGDYEFHTSLCAWECLHSPQARVVCMHHVWTTEAVAWVFISRKARKLVVSRMTRVHFQHLMHRIWCVSLKSDCFFTFHTSNDLRFHTRMWFSYTLSAFPTSRELKFHTRVCIKHTFSNSPQTTDVLRLAVCFAFPKPLQGRTGRTYSIYEACRILITLTVTTDSIQWCVIWTQHLTFPTGVYLEFHTSLCAWDCLHSPQAAVVCSLSTMSERQRL